MGPYGTYFDHILDPFYWFGQKQQYVLDFGHLFYWFHQNLSRTYGEEVDRQTDDRDIEQSQIASDY